MVNLLTIPMNEGKDVLLNCSHFAGTPHPAQLRARGALPLEHGLGQGEEAWSFAQYDDSLYIANGNAPLQSYDGEEVTRASLAAPIGELDVQSERIKLRIQDQGWVAKFGGQLTLAAGPPDSIAITSISPISPSGWVPTRAHIGKIVVIPSNRYFAGTGANDGADVIGIVDSIDSSTGITIIPVNDDGTSRWPFGYNTTTDIVCTLFDADAIGEIAYSTPYSEIRLVPNGGDELSDGYDQDGEDNDQAFEFSGSHAIRVDHDDLTDPADFVQGVVVEFKGYLRPTNLKTGNRGRRIIATRQGDARASSCEISIVEDGKFEFRFWDRGIEAYRSIRSVGIVFSEGSWHYFHFRYKFKAGGQMGRDSIGGWETDHRWINRGTTRFDVTNQYRDSLKVWDLDGRSPADPLLVAPGCHNGFNTNLSAGVNEWINRSRELGNVGHVIDEPWIGPEETDPGYATTIPAGNEIVSFESDIGIAVLSGGHYRMPGILVGSPPDIYLPRWFSLNRDVGVEDEPGKTHIITGKLYRGTTAPATLASGVMTDRAMLCYVFGRATGAAYATPRILAVQDVNNTDVSVVSQEGNSGGSFTLTDDPDLGGDGLGLGDFDAFRAYIIAFAIPNGRNHSVNATGNTSPLPTLLVQGESPVGINDDPDPEELPWYIGGSPNTEDEENAILGFEGMMDDIALSIKAVDGQDFYTEDHMMPDTNFNGPVEPRLHSLPKLNIDASTTTPEDIVTPAQTVGLPSWSSDLDAPVGGNEVTQIAGAGPGELVKLDTSIQSQGKHQLVVTFYDPDRNVESPASELGIVQITPENDYENDERLDAGYKIRLNNLPVSSDRRRRVWRRVYKTLADGATFFRAAEIRDNRTRTVEVNPTTGFLSVQPIVDFGFLEPPICSVIAASETRLYFAGIKDAIRKALGEEYADTASLVAWSDVDIPWQVPGVNRAYLQSGEGNPVRALIYQTGRMYAMKADSLFVADELGTGGLIRWRRVQSNTGAISPFALVEVEDYAVFPGEKGVMALDSSTRLLYMSPMIEQTWRGLDDRAMRFATAAYNRPRNQYCISAREQASNERQIMLTGEISDSPFAGAQDGLATSPGGNIPTWSKQLHPVGVETLISADDPFTDRRIMLMGTGMGYVMLMDIDSGIRGHEIGAIFGDVEAEIDSVVDVGVWQLKNFTSFDTEQEGLAGIPWVLTRPDANNANKETFIDQGVIFNLDSTGILRVLRRQLAPTPLEDDKIYLGGWVTSWRSKWFAVDKMSGRRRMIALHMMFEPEASGYMNIEWFSDFDDTTAVETIAHSMDKGYAYVRADVRGRYIQFRVSRAGTEKPLQIFAMSMLFEKASQRD